MATNRRFINKQQHATSCGPVAILNVRKWLGRKHTAYRPNLHHFEKWGYDEEGMWPRELSRALNAMKIKYRRKSLVNIKDIEKAVSLGHSVILCYAWVGKDGSSGTHYVFIDRDTGKCFRAWNYSSSWKTPYLSKVLLRKWFKHSKDRYNKTWRNGNPIMWVIPRD